MFYYDVNTDYDRYVNAEKWFAEVSKEDYPIAGIYCDIADCMELINQYNGAKVKQTEKMYEEYGRLWEMVGELKDKADEFGSVDAKLQVWNEINRMINERAVQFLEVATAEELQQVLNSISEEAGAVQESVISEDIQKLQDAIRETQKNWIRSENRGTRMTYEMYRYIFVIAAVLCGVMFGVSVLLFSLLKIPAVIGNLSGSTARKSIRTIEEKSSWKENGTNDPDENWKSRGRLTDKISPSGRVQPLPHMTGQMDIITTKIATQRMTSMPQSEETVELTEKTASDITTQLENVQSCGETTLLEEAAFEIELDITYIHTDEIVA